MRDAAVYIIRHGETDWNVQGIIQGQLDIGLNDAGRQQAAEVGNFLKVIPFTHAFSSDLSRASDTARAILEHHPGVVLEETELLRERQLGLMQGMSGKDAKSRRKELDKSAESHSVLTDRLLVWWTQHIEPIIHAGSPDDPPALVLAVSHGATIGTLIPALQQVLGFPSAVPIVPRQHLYNTSISLVEARVNDERTRVDSSIVLYGDIQHMLEKQEGEREKGNADVIPDDSADAAISKTER